MTALQQVAFPVLEALILENAWTSSDERACTESYCKLETSIPAHLLNSSLCDNRVTFRTNTKAGLEPF